MSRNESPINDTEINSEEGQEAPEELQTYTAKLLRPGRGSLSDLIASELAEAVHAGDPLQKIRHTLEAFNLLNEEQRKKLIPEEKDQIDYQRFYDMALSLSFMPSINVRIDYYTSEERTQIAFAFPKDQAFEHLYFFAKSFLYEVGGEENWSKFQNILKEDPNDQGAYRWYCRTLYFYFSKAQFDLQTCLQLKNAFVSHAMPKILVLLKLIFDAYVSPEVWQGIVGKQEAPKP